MQKKLIALAVAGVVAAPAFAETQLYGRIDTYVYSENNGVDSAKGVGNGGLGGSMIGINADEDLGGGMKGYLKWETQFASDTTSAPTANRYVFVGLDTGATGKIQIGAGFGPTHKTLAGFSVSGQPDWTAFGKANMALTAADNLALFGVNAAGTINWQLYDQQVANAVEYMVNAGPVALDLAIQPSYNEKGTDDANGKSKKAALDFSANFKQGPVAAALIYQSKTNRVASTDVDIKTTGIAGSYDAGVVKVMATFVQLKAEDDKNKVYEIGAAIPVGNGTVNVGYSAFKCQDCETSKGMNIDYTHKFGKRTFGYVGYGTVKNGADTTFGFNRTGNADETSKILAGGLRVTF